VYHGVRTRFCLLMSLILYRLEMNCSAVLLCLCRNVLKARIILSNLYLDMVCILAGLISLLGLTLSYAVRVLCRRTSINRIFVRRNVFLQLDASHSSTASVIRDMLCIKSRQAEIPGFK